MQQRISWISILFIFLFNFSATASAFKSSDKSRLDLLHDGQSISSLKLRAGDSGELKLINTGKRTIKELEIELPFPWQSYFTNNCPSILVPRQGCTISYSIPAISATGNFHPLSIHGINAKNNLNIPVSIYTVGAVQCWGYNKYGQLGDATTTPRSLPGLVDSSALGTDVISVTTGGFSTCALKLSGQVLCWGYKAMRHSFPRPADYMSTIPIPAHENLDADVVAISGRGHFGGHLCALKNNGRVLCWGEGVLGNGKDEPWVDNHLIDSKAIAIAVGDSHSCALKNNGQVLCWGSSYYGQLGHGSRKSSNKPELVTADKLGSDVAAITAGDSHTCALKKNGQVFCWGSNYFGGTG